MNQSNPVQNSQGEVSVAPLFGDKNDSFVETVTENKLKRTVGFSIKLKLFLIGILIMLTSALVLLQFIIPLITKGKMEERELKLKAVVDSAVSLMKYYETSTRNVVYTQTNANAGDVLKNIENAKNTVSNNIEQIRYDKTEYVFILDRSGNMVMHPTKPELEGKNMLNEKNNSGQRPFFDMVTCAQQEGGCYVRYTWQSKWSNTVFEPYTTYCSYYWPWDWVVCSGVRTQDIIDATKQITIQISIYFGLISLITSVLLYFISVLIIKPILQLADKAKNLNKTLNNQTYEEIKIVSNDEIGVLAESFNEMVVDLQKSRKNLEDLNNDLENKVAERTEELNQTMTDLERMNKLMVGRELKMVEMKKEMVALKTK
jgi:methyl-accepting chemotaxis protein